MFAEILKESKNVSSEKREEYLSIIEGESNRLTRLIDNVLDYSKIERGIKQYSFNKADLNEIVEKVMKSMEYQFKMGKFEVNISLCEHHLLVNVDKDAVIEAVINLLSNATKYSKEEKVISLSTTKKNNFAVIHVTDKGIGISQEDLKNLFEPFYQLKKSKLENTGGAGLGLAIVRHIIHPSSPLINCSTLSFASKSLICLQ